MICMRRKKTMLGLKARRMETTAFVKVEINITALSLVLGTATLVDKTAENNFKKDSYLA